MFDTDCYFEQVILVYVSFSQKKCEVNWDLREFSSLVTSAGMKIDNVLISNSVIFNAKYFIGIGKALEIKQMVKNNSSSIVLFNHTLSSRQERNLICLLQCKVIDRNQLILNIFAQRARTYEGKLQVKLAQLRYLNSRLTHEWSHLERQKGGIGLRSGPGEMQLENDRRVLRKHIFQNTIRLKKIENQRKQSRKNRFKIGVPVIALVGYTNAGKSTLFNILTASNVCVAEKLFVTLDPTFRRITYRGGFEAVLVDTVGFIQKLPNDLISSFKATLQETMESTLLLHVVDVSNEKYEQNINVVCDILNNIKIKNIPTILVMNKIDQLTKVVPHIDQDCDGRLIKVWISAKNNLGISLLVQALNDFFAVDMVNYELRFPVNHSLYKKLYQLQVVQQYWIEDDCNIRVKIYLSSISWNRLLKQNKSLINYIL